MVLIVSRLLLTSYFYVSYQPGLLILDTKSGWEGFSISLRGFLLYLILWHNDDTHGARGALEIGQEGCLDSCARPQQGLDAEERLDYIRPAIPTTHLQSNHLTCCHSWKAST